MENKLKAEKAEAKKKAAEKLALQERKIQEAKRKAAEERERERLKARELEIIHERETAEMKAKAEAEAQRQAKIKKEQDEERKRKQEEQARIDAEAAIFEEEFNKRMKSKREMNVPLVQQKDPEVEEEKSLPPCAFGDPDLLGLSEWELDLQCDDLFAEVPIRFKPKRGNSLDESIAQKIKELGITIPVKHIEKQLYLIGSARVNLELKRFLMVRAGGGYERFDEYVPQHHRYFQRSLVIHMIKSGESLEWVVDQIMAGKKHSQIPPAAAVTMSPRRHVMIDLPSKKKANKYTPTKFKSSSISPPKRNSLT